MSELLQDRVAEVARTRAAARAVVGEDASFTYGELADYAARLARTLRKRGCGRGERVAVLMPHSARAVATAVGVLEAGSVCVPLEPTGRLVRIADALRSCEPTVVLSGGCDPSVLANLESRGALRGASVGWLGPLGPPPRAHFSLDDVAVSSSRRSRTASEPDDLAVILFDLEAPHGFPPGIPLTHRNVRGLAEWAVELFDVTSRDRVSGLNALGLDLSLFDMHVTFAAGAELHVAPEPAKADPVRLARFATESALTVWLSAPASMAAIARHDAFGRHLPATIRHVLWRGETLAPGDLAYWRRCLPRATFTSLYGAPETTAACAYHRIPPESPDLGGRIPIGAARAGEELLVIDDELGVLPPGRVGELHVRGSGVSPGYWRDRERVPDALRSSGDAGARGQRMYRTGDRGVLGRDGLFRLVGRQGFDLERTTRRDGRGAPDSTAEVTGPADSAPDFVGAQEQADVEHALLQLAEVAACTVVAVPVGPFGHVLGCAYVPSNGRVLRTRDLPDRLAGKLPVHMIPTRWLVLDELPVDWWGRVDRALARTLLGGDRPALARTDRSFRPISER